MDIPGTPLGPTFERLPGTEKLLILDARSRLLLVDLRKKTITVLRDTAPQAVGFSARPDNRLVMAPRDERTTRWSVVEFDVASRKARTLLDVDGADACFAYPTRTGTMVMAWPSEREASPPDEAVLVELDAKGGTRQLGPPSATSRRAGAAGCSRPRRPGRSSSPPRE